MIWRFDDHNCNGNIQLTWNITDYLRGRYPDAVILHCVSPLVFDMSESKCEIEKQRVFPKILNAYSDFRKYYNVDRCEIPEEYGGNVITASHGLVHCDHRLMSYGAQEMSILVSASLTKSTIFVPPFNKWNKDTEEICLNHGITLIKFEDGWKCAEHNRFDESHENWYLHAREFTLESFKEWIEK